MVSAIDYGVLMEKFIDVLCQDAPELRHKSFIKKITNKIERYHKGNLRFCKASEQRVLKAVTAAEAEVTDELVDMSIAAICWLIHNRHKEQLVNYKFEQYYFEQFVRYFDISNVSLSSARVPNLIEKHLELQ